MYTFKLYSSLGWITLLFLLSSQASAQPDPSLKMVYSAIEKENVPIDKLQIDCPVFLAPIVDTRLNKETIGAPFSSSILIGPIENWVKDGLIELKRYGVPINPTDALRVPAGKEIVMQATVTRAYTWGVGLKIFSTITAKIKYIASTGNTYEKSYRVLGDKTNMWGAPGEALTTLNYGLNNLLPTLAFDLQSVCNGNALATYSFVQLGTKPVAAAVVQKPVSQTVSVATTAALSNATPNSIASPSVTSNSSRVPYVSDMGQKVFQEYLGLPTPKAFAISKTGVWRYAHLYSESIPNRSADPKLRAIENCEAVANSACILYAINQEVVFHKNLSMEERASLTALSNAEAVPYLTEKGRENYRVWLTRPLPRAFAIAANGYSWGAFGPKPADPNLPIDVVERALRACENASATECKLYAIDEKVVWTK
jgi:hypothetical protein